LCPILSSEADSSPPSTIPFPRTFPYKTSNTTWNVSGDTNEGSCESWNKEKGDLRWVNWQDAYGRAVYDYYRNKGGYEIVERDDGLVDTSSGHGGF